MTEQEATVDHPVLDHEGPWTEDTYLALARPVRDGRVELVDGALVVGPAATAPRERVLVAVRSVVEAALPAGLRVLGPVALRLGPDCVLVPDLVVTRVPPSAADGDGPGTGERGAASDARAPRAGDPPEADPAGESPPGGPGTDESGTGAGAPDDGSGPEILDAADALMVVEVVGREHGAVDRTFKPQIYARARIPYSLLVDRDGPFAVANMIIGGRYHEYAHAEGSEPLRLEEPFRMEIDLSAVTREGEAAPAAT